MQSRRWTNEGQADEDSVKLHSATQKRSQTLDGIRWPLLVDGRLSGWK